MKILFFVVVAAAVFDIHFFFLGKKCQKNVLPCWHEYINVVHPFAKRFLRSGNFFGLKFLSVKSIRAEIWEGYTGFWCVLMDNNVLFAHAV